MFKKFFFLETQHEVRFCEVPKSIEMTKSVYFWYASFRIFDEYLKSSLILINFNYFKIKRFQYDFTSFELTKNMSE